MINKEREAKKQIRQKNTQEKLREELKNLKSKIDLLSFQYYLAIAKLEEYQEELADLINTQPQLAITTLQQKIGFLFVLGIPVCAYFFNVLLIFRPAEYLIEQSLGESFIGGIAALFVPIIFVAFELGLASILYQIQDRDKLLSTRLAEIVVIITPCLLLATNLAKYSVEGRMPELYEIILLIALFILAYITDVAIVKAIRAINQAIAFIWFTAKRITIKRKISSTGKLAQDKYFQAGEALDSYIHTLAEYKQSFAESILKPPLFSNSARKFITDWLANS